MSSNNETVLSCENLNKCYQEGEVRNQVLSVVSFSLARGELAAIVGRSGSGKTTLLHLLAGLDLPDSGTVELCGRNIAQLSDSERAEQRNHHLGFVYQFHHLLPEFNALENVMMPMLIAKVDAKKARQEALLMLEEVGLQDRALHRPSKLSGGERQRVAIARALVNRPDCVLADEPTGNLDSQNAEIVQNLILDLNKSFGLSFLLVTHDERLSQGFEKVYQMQDGKLSL